MLLRALFKDDPLRLGVVAALATLTALPAAAIVLPSKPLALSSSWDCRAGRNSDWLCRSTASDNYDQTLEKAAHAERVSRSRYQPQQAISQHYIDFEPSQPLIHPTIEQPAIPQPSDDQETAQTKIQSLLSAHNRSYVVQWLAAHTEEALTDLQRRFAFLEQATVVSYRRNSKVWYVLLDGPFDSRESAMAALSSPPRLLLTDKLYPWTRSLSSIQKLDLIMPNEVDPTPSYDQPTVVDRYDYQAQVRQPNSALFASIAPAYPQIEQPYEARDYNNDPFAPIEQQYLPDNRGYDRQYSGGREVDQNFSHNTRSYYDQYQEPSEIKRARSQARQYLSDEQVPANTLSHRPEKPSEKAYDKNTDDQPKDIINAPDGSYTIQWLSSPRRETLERAKRRYSQLKNAEIIQYRKGDRHWYLLVSELYFSASDANKALGEPWLARISTRLYPRVRSVNSLRALASGYSKTITKQRSIKASSPLNEIIKSPTGSYTIQWFAANSPAAIEKMKSRFPELSTAITAYYRKNQKDWYVLIQGQYGSSREAISAIKSPQLQNAVKVLHPWTRPVKSLKKLQISDA